MTFFNLWALRVFQDRGKSWELSKVSNLAHVYFGARVDSSKLKLALQICLTREGLLYFGQFLSEVAKKSVSARPGPILEGTLGSRMGPGRAGMAPTSGLGWVRNAVKQSTWRIWTDPFRPGMGPGWAQDGTQARVWMAPPETVTDF